mmetsp:Transcript_10626/g.43521  ORF Transcript_10626/g.43521 Transcript_10626/m.43521 type:complete len:307 (+) Transcript_10626:465-1385(+)
MGRQHDVREGQQRGVHARLALEDVQARRGQAALTQGGGQRVLVDDAATRDVHQRGRGLHQGELGRADAVMRRSGIRQHEDEVVGFAQQLVLAEVAGAQLGLGGCGQARAVVIDDLHAKAETAAARDRLADAAHAEDAQRAAMHLGASEEVPGPARPAAVSQQPLALGHAPGRGHQQRKAEVGRGLGQHIGRVGDKHTTRAAGGHVDVVVAHRHRADGAQLGAGVQQLGADALGAGDEDPGLAAQALAQLLGRQRHLARMQVDLEVRRQAAQHLGRRLSCDEDARLHIHIHAITKSSGSSTAPDHSR